MSMQKKESIFGVSPNISMNDAVIDYVMTHWQAYDRQNGIILLPNRRSVHALRERFFAIAGDKTLVLPSIIPLADVDLHLLLHASQSVSPQNLALQSPVINNFTRIMLLTKQVQKFYQLHHEPLAFRHAMELATSLAQWLDDAISHEVKARDLQALAKGEHSEHWQRILPFLKIVYEGWPELAQKYHCTSHAQALYDTLTSLAKIWRQSPPSIPILAAGSTGSQSATAELLTSIAFAPKGVVMIPGVFAVINPEYEATIDKGHPLFYAKQLVQKMQTRLSEIPVLQPSNIARDNFLTHAFAPAQFHGKIDFEPPSHIKSFVCAHEWEEVRVIALLVQKSLADSQDKIMVVSPDRQLLGRVGVELQALGIFANNSGADTLSLHPFTQWLRLLMRVVLSDAHPADVLAWLGHQAGFCLQSLDKQNFYRRVDEAYARGNNKAHGLAEFVSLCLRVRHESTVAGACEQALAPFIALMNDNKNKHMTHTIALWMEAISHAASHCEIDLDSDKDIAAALMQFNEMGEVLSVNAADFDAMLEQAFLSPWFAESSRTHPNVHLHTPIEARMQTADRVILSGLNEGVWPANISNLWLNAALLERLHMPHNAHAVSLQAHDFLMLSGAKYVWMTRALKINGADMAPSRFWQRIMLAMSQHGVMQAEQGHDEIAAILAHENRYATYQPAQAPRPMPDIARRARTLSITELEYLWINPYIIYARHTLGLKPLQEIDEEVDMRLFGTLAHRICEQISKSDVMEIESTQNHVIESHLAEQVKSPVMQMLWRPRLKRIVQFFVANHRMRSALNIDVQSEMPIKTFLKTASGEVLLKGKADRIEQRKTGELFVVDIKTSSTVPSEKAIMNSEAPQLPFYAKIIQEKYSADNPDSDHANAVTVEYWQCPRGSNEGEIKTLQLDDEMLDEIIENYRTLAEHLLFQPTPFLYNPHRIDRDFDDYAALARADEWEGVGQ